jgi:glycosyltransferase involved in cell wall biosynthesis
LAYREKLQQLLSGQRFDVLHFHGIDCDAYLPDAGLTRGVSKLVTLHLPFEWYPERLFQRDMDLSFTCVSAWQGRQVQQRLPVRATIENGVDLQRWQPLPEQPTAEYVACLGRICPEKGFDMALRAAHSAGVTLLLAGQVFGYSEHQAYFSECILPLLDEQRRFIGPVAGSTKREFLARARCLVVSSRVAETSSLVTMEALACGTPVIVSGAGAPHSLIEPGVTGLVAEDEADLTAALQRVHQLDRHACRASAEQRFDLRHTARRYLELYAELAQLARGQAAAWAK